MKIKNLKVVAISMILTFRIAGSALADYSTDEQDLVSVDELTSISETLSQLAGVLLNINISESEEEGSVLGAATYFSNETTDQTIERLKTQIAELVAQLSALEGQQVQGDKWCHTFNKNIGIDASGNEVAALEKALALEGFPVEHSSNFPSEYNEQLAAFVSAFQEKYRDEILTSNGLKNSTGYVGPATRKKLNQLYGCGIIQPKPYPSPIPTPTPTQASITVLSPNGGETWQKGTEQIIRWEDNAPQPACPVGASCPTMDRYYTIKLLSYYPPCTGNICPAMPYIAPYTIAQGVLGPSYPWKVGSVRSMTSAVSSFMTIPDGSYTVQVCESGTTRCDSGNSYFKIVSSGTNLPPVISGVSGPTSMNVNQQGTWTVKAHDPENGSLTYDVCWGDGQCGVPGGLMQTGLYTETYNQTATFSHTYSKSGVYTIIFSVTDNSNQQVKSSLSVNVSGDGTITTCDNYGDVSMDGTVNSVDALYVRQYVQNSRTFTEEQKLRADVNQDGKVDNTDADIIQSYDVGSIKVFPACQKKPPCLSYGDVNGNSYVNRRDSQLVLEHDVGNIILTPDQQKRANVNNDNGVNSIDALLIGQYSAGIINTFAVCGQQTSIIVTSPRGGESWQRGTTQKITWTTSSPISIQGQTTVVPPTPYPTIAVDIFLDSYQEVCVPSTDVACPLTQTSSAIRSYTIAKNYYSGVFYWVVPKNLEGLDIRDGAYTVRICAVATNRCDSSDSYFKITSQSIQLSVTVLSPNGGEVFVQGLSQTIRWTGGKNIVQIGLVQESATNNTNPVGEPYLLLGWIDNNAKPNSYITWDGKKVCGGGNVCWPVNPGRYKIIALTQDQYGNDSLWDSINNKPGSWDLSDAPFSIVSGSIGLPDLAIRNISKYSSALIPNGVSFDLCNYGSVTTQTFPLRITANGITQKFTFPNINLVAGGCSPNAWEYSMWSMSSNSTYTVTATADPDNTISESNEGNNTYSAVLSGNQAQPSITVTSPNGGETWQQGTTQKIQWSTNAQDNAFIKIGIRGNNSYQTIFSNTPNDGYELWTVPATLALGKYSTSISICRSDNDCYWNDWSDAPFSIVAETPIFPVNKLDLNSDGNVDGSDSNFLADIIMREVTCPTNRNCDINGDATTDAGDLTQYYFVNTPYDLNGDGAVTSSDNNLLVSVIRGITACPAGKTCDTNADGAVNAYDLSALNKDNSSLSCSVPQTMSPSGTVTPSANGTVDLSWQSIPDAAYYAVRLDDGSYDRWNDSRYQPCMTGGSPHYYCQNGIVGTTITGVPVKAGRTYKYWVDPIYYPQRNDCQQNYGSFTVEATNSAVSSVGSVLGASTEYTTSDDDTDLWFLASMLVDLRSVLMNILSDLDQEF